MDATIVIPTYNAEKCLPSLIPFLNEATQKFDLDILFMDSSSQDKTVEIINALSDFEIITVLNSDFDHGGTRSLAKKYFSTDLVIFLTQDALPFSASDFIKLLDVFKDNSIAAAYGRQLPYEESNLFGKHLREFNYPAESYVRSIVDKKQFGIKTASLSNSFAAYRRSSLDEIGWFKDGLILGEDAYAGARLLLSGYRLAYVGDAQVYHSHSYTVWEEFKRYFDIGVFHQMESWILDEFGKPEGEGMRYVKSEYKYLVIHNSYHLIPEFFIRNGMKFLGYKLGQHYKKLPKNLIKKFSMHHRWWDKYWITVN